MEKQIKLDAWRSTVSATHHLCHSTTWHHMTKHSTNCKLNVITSVSNSACLNDKSNPRNGKQTIPVIFKKPLTYVCGRQNCDTCNKHSTNTRNVFTGNTVFQIASLQRWLVASFDSEKQLKTPDGSTGWYSSPLPRCPACSEPKLLWTAGQTSPSTCCWLPNHKVPLPPCSVPNQLLGDRGTRSMP